MKYKTGAKVIMVNKKEKIYATGKLKELREAAGYSQEQMADVLALDTGMSISTSLYQKWERGEQNLSADQMIAVCGYFKVPSIELAERR